MADLIIKPATGDGNKLILQDKAGGAVLTTADSGATMDGSVIKTGTIANAVQDNITRLGTVTSGNLSSEDIVMPRFKEFDQFYCTSKTLYSGGRTVSLNISDNKSVSITPEDTGDLIEIMYSFSVYVVAGYFGHGIQRATDSNFTQNVAVVFNTGEHSHGQHGLVSSDGMRYGDIGRTWNSTCSGLTPGTTYYYRVVGARHTTGGDIHFAQEITNDVNGVGVYCTIKRWSIV